MRDRGFGSHAVTQDMEAREACDSGIAPLFLDMVAKLRWRYVPSVYHGVGVHRGGPQTRPTCADAPGASDAERAKVLRGVGSGSTLWNLALRIGVQQVRCGIGESLHARAVGRVVR